MPERKDEFSDWDDYTLVPCADPEEVGDVKNFA